MATASRPQYRFADNAVGNNTNEYGNYLLKRGVGEIRKPSWNRTETVIRILPQYNFAESKWEPFRCSPAPMDFGDWIRRYDAVRGFGESGITMFLYDPVNDPNYDLQSNPCVILYRAINNAIDAKQCEPDWPSLLKGAPGRRAVLGRHGHIYITRCGIFRIKSKDMATNERSPLGLATGDSAYFMELSKTTGEKLIHMLEERKEDFQGDPDDMAGYVHGDIVSLDAGAYVHIFEEGADPRVNQSQHNAGAPRHLQVGSGGRGNYGGGGGGGGGNSFKGYDIYIEPTWNGYAPQLNTPEMERLLISKQRPWEDCLQFLEHQEQAFLVQDGFPASAILYAWRDHPEWIKDQTRSRAVNRVSTIGEPRQNGFDARPVQPAQTGPALQRAVVAPSAPMFPALPAAPSVIPVVTQPTPVAPAPEAATVAVPTQVALQISAPAAPATATPAAKVGGWGAGSWSTAPDGSPTTVDNVVPPAITGVAAGTAVDSASGDDTRKLRAAAALQAARARAGR